MRFLVFDENFAQQLLRTGQGGASLQLQIPESWRGGVGGETAFNAAYFKDHSM